MSNCKKIYRCFLVIGLNFLLAQSPPLLGDNYNWQGEVFPNINYIDLDGTTRSLDNLDTDVILLDFWYIACQPCLKAFPSIEDLQKKYKNNNVTIIALNPLDKMKDMKEFWESNGYSFITATVSKDLFFDSLKFNVMPRTVILDGNRKVLLDAEGFMGHKSISSYDKVIKSLTESPKQIWKFWEN